MCKTKTKLFSFFESFNVEVFGEKNALIDKYDANFIT